MAEAKRFVERAVVPGMRLGLRPSDPDKSYLEFERFWTGTVPSHPTTVNNMASVADWGMYGNDKFGTCGPASVGNFVKYLTKDLTGTEVSPSVNDAYDLYRRSGNPTFNSSTGSGDNGVSMAVMLGALTSGGIGGMKSLAYAKVDNTNLNAIRAAIAIFGGLLLGINMQTAQQNQTNANPPLWNYSQSAVWGGHAVVAGKYTSQTSGADIGVVSWAKSVGTTDSFWTHQVQEAWAVILPAHLGTTQFITGIDTATLNADYLALTGNPGPFTSGGGGDPGGGDDPPPDPSDPAVATFLSGLRGIVTTVDNGLTNIGY
jgi:hypothetical protein